MSVFRVAIVEDEWEFRSQIKEYISNYASENNLEMEITEFRNGLEFTSKFTGSFDVILLDIEMPRQNGMDTAYEIRKKDKDVVIVFITNMAQYAIKGYEVDALDFILKPINYFAFSKRFARAIKRVKKDNEKQISLTIQNNMISLNLKDIYYIESSNRFLNYYTADKSYSVRGTMKSAEEELSADHFVRCNHWYLVNLRHVSSITGTHVELGSYTLEISRRNKTAFREAFTRFIQEGK